MDAAGFYANTGNTVWWADADPRGERFGTNDPGFHVDRAGLERVLVAAAESFGVRLLLGMSARAAVQREDGDGVSLVRAPTPGPSR